MTLTINASLVTRLARPPCWFVLHIDKLSHAVSHVSVIPCRIYIHPYTLPAEWIISINSREIHTLYTYWTPNILILCEVAKNGTENKSKYDKFYWTFTWPGDQPSFYCIDQIGQIGGIFGDNSCTVEFHTMNCIGRIIDYGRGVKKKERGEG